MIDERSEFGVNSEVAARVGRAFERVAAQRRLDLGEGDISHSEAEEMWRVITDIAERIGMIRRIEDGVRGNKRFLPCIPEAMKCGDE